MSAIKKAITELEKSIHMRVKDVKDALSVEKLKSDLLSRGGELTGLLRSLKDISGEEKVFAGKTLNKIKTELESFCSSKLSELEKARMEDLLKCESEDVTLPGEMLYRGGIHPLSQTVHTIIDIFSRLGFVCADGPEVETDYNNFEALNFPHEHPARDMHDTFYLSANDGKKDYILRTHTSPVQIRVMKTRKPPLRILIPGRVFRHEATDATHSFVFHQVEGLAVGAGINFTDLKGNLVIFAEKMFGSKIKTRFRPSFFPFTEPSAEMDIGCIFCARKGCRTCKFTGWLEIMGAGMVHPYVFDAVGYDNEKYTGYAFGMGVERITMLKHGINDMRLFYENDLRFLRQF